MRHALAQRDDIEQTSLLASDAELMRLLNLPDVHPEGQFFPDTYQFAKRSTDLDILRMAQQRMQSELNKAWQERSALICLLTVHMKH